MEGILWGKYFSDCHDPKFLAGEICKLAQKVQPLKKPCHMVYMYWDLQCCV